MRALARRLVRLPKAYPVACLLAVLAIAVYTPGFTWGMPHATASDRTHAWGNDDLVPLAPLAEMHNTFFEAKPDRNIAYPWFHYAVVTAAYTPYLVPLALTGGLSAPTEAYPFGFEDPVRSFDVLSWLGRLVTLILAMAVVLGAYATAATLWDRQAGVFAALATMSMYPMVYYAKLGNLDIPVLAWTSLGLAAAAHCLRHGLTVKRGILLGAFVALAGATKDQSLGSFVLIGPALVILHFWEDPSRRLTTWRSGWAPVVASLAGFVATYVLASGIPIDPARYVQHMGKVLSAGAGTTLYLRYPQTADGYLAQVVDLFWHLRDVLGTPTLLLAAVGLGLAAARNPRTLVLALASLSFAAMLVPVRFSRIHYLLPVGLPLTLYAGYAVTVGMRRGSWVRTATLAYAVVSIGWMTLRSADLTADMMRDSRHAAAEWLEQNARAGDRLMYFGAVLRNPHLSADVVTVHVDYRADAWPALETEPELVLIMPDDTNEDRQRVEWRRGGHSIRSGYVPEDLYEALLTGGAPYRLVAQFQSRRMLPWLPRPFLSYPTVNPPIQIFARNDRAAGHPEVEPWEEAPYYPAVRRADRLTIEVMGRGPPPPNE